MTAIREALQALEQHPDATVRNTASFVIAALWEAKAEAAEADARRYRWLRVQGHKDIAACWLLPRPYPEPLEITNPEDFNAAIDAAIQAEGEKRR